MSLASAILLPIISTAAPHPAAVPSVRANINNIVFSMRLFLSMCVYSTMHFNLCALSR
jgi:hypothetical protein